MSQDINVLALVKGSERYVFLFDDNNRTETLRQIGRYAADPDLSFNWYDAAVMSQKIRQAAQQQAERERVVIPRSSRFRLPLTSDNYFDGEDAG